jgi:flagellar biosynthesis protein FliR
MIPNSTLSQMADRLSLGFDINYSMALAMLILARTVPMIVLTPIFGGKLVTGQIKIGIAMILVLSIYPILSPITQGKIPLQGLAFWSLLIKEASIGAVIGFASSLVFHAIESAGNLIDIQRGTQQASVLVPQLDIQGPIFANLHIQLSTVLFFMLNGHHIFLRGFYDSFQLIPVYQFPGFSQKSLPFIEQLIHMSGSVLLVSFQLAAPIVLAIFMVDIVLGVANRIAPQVNVYIMGMPIKAAVGIIMFIASFVFILRYMSVLFTGMLGDVRLLLGYLKLG